MGCHDFYNLDLRLFESREDVDVKVMKQLMEEIRDRYKLDDLFDDYGESSFDGGRWDSFEHDMRDFSKRTPEIEFKVEVQYEYADEQPPEIFWFHKGEMKFLPGKIIYPKYEEVEYE